MYKLNLIIIMYRWIVNHIWILYINIILQSQLANFINIIPQFSCVSNFNLMSPAF